MQAAAGTLALAYFAVHGVPGALKPRRLGHGEEPLTEQPAKDPSWPFRGRVGANEEQKDLTREPVMRRGGAQAMATAAAATATAAAVDLEPDVVVVGGAAGGLTVAAALQRRGVQRVVVFEKNERAGDIWRSRYHRLHLHDIAEECSLPYFALPEDFPVFIPREAYAGYLDAYASTLGLNVQYLSVVKSLEQVGATQKWKVVVENLATGTTNTYTCKHVVLCNGVYNDPIIPNVEGRDTFPGFQCHSARYTNASDLGLVGKDVLVVGIGNSAGEIAVDLCEHGAKPTILARSPQVILPRWFFEYGERAVYTHINPLLKIPFGWVPVLAGVALLDPVAWLVQYLTYGGRAGMEKLGIPLDWRGPALKAVMDKEPPMMDIGTVELAKRGLLKVKGSCEMKRIRGDGVVEFTDGSQHKFDAIVWGTGYQEFMGHQHMMSAELLARVGKGKDYLVSNRILPGSQHPSVKHLWLNFGRIQMLRDGAKKISWGIAKDLGATSENDAFDQPESLASVAAKHVAAVVALVGWNALRGGGGGAAKL